METYYKILNGKRVSSVYDGRPDGSILIRLDDRTEIVIFSGVIRQDDVVLTINTTKCTIRIENWAVITPVVNPYAAPETQPPSLYGQVYGHPRFNDGEYVTTSLIVGKNEQNEILTNSGNAYELGKVDLRYEKQFPGAKSRLLGRLKLEQRNSK